jgi:serine/threonine protein kinase/tetratricopeptide (TPR) repeat protein
MTPSTAPSSPPIDAVDPYVKAFEAAWVNSGPVAVEAFLPSADDPVYPRAVRELVRVDLEFGWNCGKPRGVDDYRRSFPTVFADRANLAAVAFEEYRQRRGHGENPDLAEYSTKYGVDTAEWPGAQAAVSSVQPPRTVVVDGAAGLAAASVLYRQLRDAGVDLDNAAVPAAADDAFDLIKGIHRADPAVARKLTDATLAMPQVGEEFLGFHLEAELGAGAFGRVFLARQLDLAERPVALKVTADLSGEEQTLAQLEHTNIVPLYDCKRRGAFRAVVMPFKGGTTLADMICGLRESKSLPASGRHIVSTLNDRMLSTVRTGSASGIPSSRRSYQGAVPRAAAEAHSPADRPAATLSRFILDQFEGFTYVKAVLWIGARLADGLAYAHDRGIVHRDLKPANVLLTDEGQPMLLDFNLADDARLRDQAAAARMGGTLPYMSPEQLTAFTASRETRNALAAAVDARTDVYSLGLILYELLTGRPAFPHRPGRTHESLPLMIEDRRQPPPRLRPYNPDITPATEAIVRRCIEPDPAKRYPSARALQEDIDRHLADRPLRHTPEPSLAERTGKWARRHPRLASWPVAGVVAAAAVVVALGWTVAHGRQLARLRAVKQLAGLETIRNEQQVLLNAVLNTGSRPDSRRAADLARSGLAAYGLPDDPNWRTGPLVAPLSPAEQDQLAEKVAGMLLTWADAEQQWAKGEPPDQKRAGLALAMRLTDQAAACLGDADNLAVWGHRAALAGELGREDHEVVAAKAEHLKPRTAEDHFFLGRALTRQRDYKNAVVQLTEATRQDPKHYWAWNNLGSCYLDLGDVREAVACYGACAGMADDPATAFFAHYHRGLAFLKQRAYAAAEADLHAAVGELADLPDELLHSQRPRAYLLLAEILMSRGQLFGRQVDLAAAEKVLTDALAHDDGLILHLRRAEVRTLRKDKPGADRDWDAVLMAKPTDEHEITFRGVARLERGDTQGALADYDEALAGNPTFAPALQNKANVLSEKFGKDDEALAVQDELVKLYPDYVKARIGRAVLLARKGERQKAHADAIAALALNRDGETLYMAANVYALTSKQEPNDAERVLPLLAAALLSNFDELNGDADMDSVRGQPWFQPLVASARAITKDVTDRANVK